MIKSKQFRHKETGEIKTQISILEMGDYEEVDNETKKFRL